MPLVNAKSMALHRGTTGVTSEIRKPSTIKFVRSRMLYARAALNAKGGVRFGLRHIRTSSCLSHHNRS